MNYTIHLQFGTFACTVIIFATLLAIHEIYRLKQWRDRYRKLWIETGKRREDANNERQNWEITAKLATDSQRETLKTLMRYRTDYTRAMEVIDALMNGDRSCVKGHRYYTGQGISCPHCGAEENTPICILCGTRRAIVTGYSGQYCAECDAIPF